MFRSFVKPLCAIAMVAMLSACATTTQQRPATSLFTSPLRADRASDVARKYLTTACADGNERVGVYDTSLDAFVDLTLRSDAMTGQWDIERLLPYCAQQQLTVFHCHTTNDVFSLFPSYLDLLFAADIEHDCSAYGAIRGIDTATIVHRLISVPGDGLVVEYGLSAQLRERIRGLGRVEGTATQVQEQDPAVFDERRNRADEMRRIRDAAYIQVTTDVLGFAYASCPAVQNPEEFLTCGAITLERFLQTRTGAEQYCITVQRSTPER